MSARHVSHCLQDDPWNCPGCRADMRRDLRVPKPADFPELRDEVERLRTVIRTGGAMYRAERATMGIPGGIDPSDKFQSQRDAMAAHREYLDGCSKRAQSKYQALLAVAKAARKAAEAVDGRATVDCPECSDGFRDHPGCPACLIPKHMGHARECQLVALRAALAKLDEAES